ELITPTLLTYCPDYASPPNTEAPSLTPPAGSLPDCLTREFIPGYLDFISCIQRVDRHSVFVSATCETDSGFNELFNLFQFPFLGRNRDGVWIMSQSDRGSDLIIQIKVVTVIGQTWSGRKGIYGICKGCNIINIHLNVRVPIRL
ncbi:hypothetical protein CEXT_751861, partial [Caerostris extrusa]